MNRKEAKELLPIMQAFAEGKTIEIFDDVMGWVKTENLVFNLSPEFYRTNSKPKSNPKYWKIIKFFTEKKRKIR